MDKDKRIQELELELKRLKHDPRAAFYEALVIAVERITQGLKEGSLNLEEDLHAKSIITLAKESDKIFAGLSKGLECLESKDEEDIKSTSANRRLRKTETRPIASC